MVLRGSDLAAPKLSYFEVKAKEAFINAWVVDKQFVGEVLQYPSKEFRTDGYQDSFIHLVEKSF